MTIVGQESASVPRPPLWLRYGVAIFAVGTATALIVSVESLSRAPLFLLLAAVMGSAWVGGFRTGLLATASALLAGLLFLPERAASPDAFLWGLFMAVGAGTSALIGAQRAVRLRSESSAREAQRERIARREAEEAQREKSEALEAVFREAQEANRIKDEFLATVSHELRTPLTAIVGWAQMLRSGRLDPDTAARALEIIDRNAHAQTQLIADILDVSHIITGKLRLHVRPVALGPVVEAALAAVRPAAEAREIRLIADLDPAAGPVSGDPDRLQQVVWNLLSNAIKFTPPGGRVDVRLVRVDSHAEIEVQDTGAGIQPEFLPHVFGRFRQGDASSTRAHGGLGLGLAIVRHLVELHGGSVQAQSAGEGQGATFTVRLPILSASAREPRAASPERRQRTSEPSPALDSRALAGLRVVLVEDEPDARDLVRALLEQQGVEVTAAATAEEAVRAVEGAQPDVLLCDIELPDEDGYSVMRRIRALAPERGGRTPAAALTAYARTGDRMQALLSGFQVHIPKPVQPEELVTVVASLADARRGRSTRAARARRPRHAPKAGPLGRLE